jgi:hypothetical protein
MRSQKEKPGMRSQKGETKNENLRRRDQTCGARKEEPRTESSKEETRNEEGKRRY